MRLSCYISIYRKACAFDFVFMMKIVTWLAGKKKEQPPKPKTLAERLV